MSNPLIDNLTWNPHNKAASVRALQTALMALQTEWDAKTQITSQISRSGRVTADDWSHLDTEREDLSLLHFDNTAPAFNGEWTNVLGDIAPSEAVAQPGFSEFIPFGVINTGVAVPVASTISVASATVDIAIPAKLLIYLPFMGNYDVMFTWGVEFELFIDGISVYYLQWSANSSSNNSASIIWLTEDTYEGSIPILLEATRGVGSSTRVLSDPAPVPNITTLTPPLLGVVTPTTGYIEVIYR